jgi:hypothetical protein
LGEQVQPLTLLTLLMTAAVLAERWQHQRGRPAGPSERAAPWSLLGVLMVMPYVLAVGTNTLFAYAMAQAAVFWTLALAVALVIGAARLSPDAQQERAVAGMGVVLAVLALVMGVSTAAAGLGPSSTSARVPVQVGDGHLWMSSNDATSLGAVADLRRRYSLDDSTPSIDLTGILPGYQLQLGTRPLGRPSYYGFFPGARQAALYGLSLASCQDRGRAWLLYAPDNPSDISPAHTRGVLNLGTDYEEVGAFHPSQGPPSWRKLTVQVLRPRDVVPSKIGC